MRNSKFFKFANEDEDDKKRSSNLGQSSQTSRGFGLADVKQKHFSNNSEPLNDCFDEYLEDIFSEMKRDLRNELLSNFNRSSVPQTKLVSQVSGKKNSRQKRVSSVPNKAPICSSVGTKRFWQCGHTSRNEPFVFSILERIAKEPN